MGSLRIFQKGFNFSQDGPGNRLVYHLQGCNLRCPWCSNPEGLCSHGGEDRTVDELVAEVLRSRLMFFDGGGVTLTGGEVSMQLEEVKEFLFRLRREGIHTCIETNGIHARLPELFEHLDLLIMDLKHHDPKVHKSVTGAENTLTVRNISAALAAGLPLALRIPLVGGFNASDEDAFGFAALLTRLGVAGKATVELLAYHEYGKDKYAKLGLPYTMGSEAKVTRQQLEAVKTVLQEAGITVIHT